MDVGEQHKTEAIFSALKGTKYSTDKKQNFAKAIVGGLTNTIDFASNLPEMRAWIEGITEPSLAVAEALTEFLIQYHKHSDNDWVKAAIYKGENFISQTNAIRIEFTRLALGLNKKKKPGPNDSLGYLVAMFIAECYLEHFGECPSSGKGKKLNSHNSANIYMSAYDRVCAMVEEKWAVPISDTTREKARVEIRSRVK